MFLINEIILRNWRFAYGRKVSIDDLHPYEKALLFAVVQATTVATECDLELRTFGTLVNNFLVSVFWTGMGRIGEFSDKGENSG